MSTDSPAPTTSPYDLRPTVHEGVRFEVGDTVKEGVVIERIPKPVVHDLDRMILRVETDAGVERVLRDDVL